MKLRIVSLVAGLATIFMLSSCSTTSTPSGASDPEGTRVAQAYHILAKCDRDCDDHISRAMDLADHAAKVLGVDVHADGVEDHKEGYCIEHVQTAVEMLRIAHDRVPDRGDRKGIVAVGTAMREAQAALDCLKNNH